MVGNPPVFYPWVLDNPILCSSPPSKLKDHKAVDWRMMVLTRMYMTFAPDKGI
jgi:hypothetical protein